MMKRMGGFGSKKINKKGRKGKKGSGGGRVTQGRAPLRLPNLDPSDLPPMPGQKQGKPVPGTGKPAPGTGKPAPGTGKKGLPSLPGLDDGRGDLTLR